MHIFILIAGLDDGEETGARALAVRGLTRLFEVELELGSPDIAFTRLNRQLLVTADKSSEHFPRTTVLEGRQHDLVYFGDDGGGDGLRRAWAGEAAQSATASAQSLRAQDGCFGAALLARTAPQLHLFCDITGQRRLRYAFRANGTLIVSSHDVGLALMGALEPRVDEDALTSLARLGWSLGGRPLLRGGTAAPPWAMTSFAPAGATPPRRIASTTTTLPDPAATEAPAADLLLEDFAARLGPARRLRVQLTAGWDSRAALAAALAVREAGDVETWVEGPADCLDVRRARELSARLGLAFSHRELPTLSPEAFRFHLTRSCVAANGTIETYILPSNAGITPPPGTLAVTGAAGEIYRRPYYAYRPFAHLLDRPYGSARSALRRRFCKTTASAELCRRLDDVVDNLSRISRSQPEILDRFYATERFGIWAASGVLNLSGFGRLSPFESRRLTSRAFATTTARGFDYALHRELIRRFTPRLLDVPFNDDALARRAPTSPAWRVWDEALAFTKLLRRRAPSPHRRSPPASAGTGEERKASVEAAVAALRDGETALFAGVGRELKEPAAARVRHHLGALRFLKICFELIEEARRAEQTAPAVART